MFECWIKPQPFWLQKDVIILLHFRIFLQCSSYRWVIADMVTFVLGELETIRFPKSTIFSATFRGEVEFFEIICADMQYIRFRKGRGASYSYSPFYCSAQQVSGYSFDNWIPDNYCFIVRFRSKTKTNGSRLARTPCFASATGICFEVWSVYWIFCVLRD